jgi:putative flavoprotein involved in K+ transport
MRRTHTTIIGGGQAGLALSRCLADRGVEHLVLERGAVGERWRTRRRSLRLLTPNWMSRLPGWRYQGEDPDGFMTMPEVVGFLERYARSFGAPVETGTTVEAVHRAGGGYRIRTDRGEIASRNVVVATGACDVPSVPGFARHAHPDLVQLTPASYRGPERLPDGGVLVVGASASGAQVAAELRAAGRQVVLAVGRHARLPRTYRGRDIHHWLDRLGVLRKPAEPGAGSPPALSVQLVGSPERREVDLATLQRAGVVLAGRLTGIDGSRTRFAGDLYRHAADADRRLVRLLRRVDDHIAATDRVAAGVPAEPVRPVAAGPVIRELDLAAAGIGTVLWATGYRRRYPWLRVPVLRPDGEIRHRHGVTAAPGLYAIGLPLQSRRNSTFIDGVRHDALSITRQICVPSGGHTVVGEVPVR